MAAKKKEKAAEQEEKQQAEVEQKLADKDPLKEAKIAIDEEKNKFLRLFAEFENYKKRTSRERLELFKTAAQDVMVALLPVLDDFERALSEMGNEDSQQAGIQLIYNKLNDTLAQQGLTKMEVQVKDSFDAEIHEAITQLPASDEFPKGTIIDIVGAGYKLGDLIIRYPKVVVAQ
ncbi:MAG: nucleotide exchange factor GrpE [Flavobacteriaceae bacterium]